MMQAVEKKLIANIFSTLEPIIYEPKRAMKLANTLFIVPSADDARPRLWGNISMAFAVKPEKKKGKIADCIAIPIKITLAVIGKKFVESSK